MAKKLSIKRVLALLLALTLCFSNFQTIALADGSRERPGSGGESSQEQEANWSYAYYLGQEYLGNAHGAAVKPDPVGYGFQGVITSITFTDDVGKTWTFTWSSADNGEWRITGSGVTKEEAAAWPQITSGKVYYGSGYAFTLSEDGSAGSWTYTNDSSRHANWFRYIRFLGPYTVNVYYENPTGGYSYAGEVFALHQTLNKSFYFQYPNNGIIGDSEYEDSEYSSAITLYPKDYLPEALVAQGYELKYATDADGKDVLTTGVPIHLLGKNVLNVYCTLVPPVTEDYKVVHNYYVEGTFEGTQSGGTIQVPQGSDFATVVAGIEKLPIFGEFTYTYQRYDVDPSTKTITLTYSRVRPTYGYTVTYHENFGTSTATVADKENVTAVHDTTYEIKVDENTYFTQESHYFTGWNTEPDGSGTPYSAQDVVALTKDSNTEDLYAQWSEKPKYDYTVIYHENFGTSTETVADSENTTQVYDTTWSIEVDGNPFPVREHFHFAGWATTPEGGVAYNPTMTLTFTNGGYQDLYAVWVEDPKFSYTLVYDGNGGTLADGTALVSDEENVANTYDISWEFGINANPFVKANHTFKNWNTAPDGSGTTYTPQDALTLTKDQPNAILYAQWEENPKYDYRVIYNANFGENPPTVADSENVTQVYDTAYTIHVDENTYFTRENYTFKGWSLTSDGSRMVAVNSGIGFNTETPSEVIVYAIWKENPKYDYTLTYNANFGENPPTVADSENVTQVYDTVKVFGVDENTYFTRENYDFTGWSTSPEGPVNYPAGSGLTMELGGSEVLYAQWKEHDKYSFTLVYDGNGGVLASGENTYGDDESVAGTYATSNTFTVDANTFLRPNHTFLGWNTEADGSGTAYASPDQLTLTVSNPTEILYAQWQEHPKYDYRVIYNANYGENPETVADLENASQVYDATYAITVDENTYFTRSEYKFLGWSLTPDGAQMVTPGTDILFSQVTPNEVTLYAVWQLIPKYDYTLIYNANFGETPETAADLENASQVYDVSYTITVDENTYFTREEYDFLGWSLAPEGPVDFYPNDTITFTYGGQMELFAQWKLKEYPYTVTYLVRVDEGEYQEFTGTLPEDAHLGGILPLGTTVGEEIVNPPATLTDELYTYDYDTLDEIVITAGENEVKVYYQYNTPAAHNETEPTEPEPTESEPTESEPTEPEPTEPEPTEPEPTEPEPAEPEPTEPEPTEPEPTEPEPTEPEPTEPEPTEPEPTEPEPTEPEPTEPEPTEPEPTDPEPTEPEPTEPEPTEPEPTDPEPTDPKPTDPEDIPDEEVPLAEVPQTGDPMLLYTGLMAFSGFGIFWLGRKKEEEEA